MKRLAVTLIGVGLVLSGCSSAPSEVSPEEKRNNNDFCNLTEKETYLETIKDETEWQSSSLEEKERLLNFIEDEISVYCKDKLE